MTKKLQRKAIEEIKGMVQELYEENGDLFIVEAYWDYNEELSPSMLHNCNSKADLEDELYDWNVDYFAEVEYYAIERIYDELDIDINDYEDIEDELREIARDYISHDINLKDLSRLSRFKMDLIPMQEENLDSEGGKLSEELCAMENSLLLLRDGEEEYNKKNGYWYIDIDTAREYKPSTLIKSLFDSQGYEYTDLIDSEKVENSKFLDSFLTELVNRNPGGGQFLTILINGDLETYFDIIEENAKTITVYPEEYLTIGLVGLATGGGSTLAITLEKPWTIDLKDVEIQIEGSSYNYGYTVDSIYGLIGQAWTDNFKLN